jgi:WD40 repeat protein
MQLYLKVALVRLFVGVNFFWHYHSDNLALPWSRAEIVAGSVDGTVRCFDVRAGSCSIDDCHHPVSSMALSNDGNCMLSACLDGAHMPKEDAETEAKC